MLLKCSVAIRFYTICFLKCLALRENAKKKVLLNQLPVELGHSSPFWIQRLRKPAGWYLIYLDNALITLTNSPLPLLEQSQNC